MSNLITSVIVLIVGYCTYLYYRFKSDVKVLKDSEKVLDDVKVIEIKKTELKTDLKTEEENLKKEQGKSASNEELSDFFNNHKS